MTIATATTEYIHPGVRPHRQGVEGADGGAGASALLKARLAGALWLTVVATGMFAFFAAFRLIVAGDPAATAAGFRDAEPLFRLGFVSNLLSGACYLGVTVLLYPLLRPVSRSVSLSAAALGVVGVAVGAATSLLQLSSLILLGEADYLGAFTGEQLQVLALTFLGTAAQGFSIGMVFFGFQCLLLGALVARSGFLPRPLGVLLAAGGASYVISSFASFLAPALGTQLVPFIMPIALLGEGSLSLWLVVKGVDVARWGERARAAELRA